MVYLIQTQDSTPAKPECIGAVVWLAAAPDLYLLAYCEGYVKKKDIYLCTVNGVDNFVVKPQQIFRAHSNRAAAYWKNRALAAEKALFPERLGVDQEASYILKRELEAGDV